MIRHWVKIALTACIFAMLSAPVYADPPVAGTMKLNPATKKMMFYNGTQWREFAIVQSATPCDLPDGAMDYDPLLLDLLGGYKYCRNGQWALIAGTISMEGPLGLVPAICAQNRQIEFRNGALMHCAGLLWHKWTGPVTDDPQEMASN